MNFVVYQKLFKRLKLPIRLSHAVGFNNYGAHVGILSSRTVEIPKSCEKY